MATDGLLDPQVLRLDNVEFPKEVARAAVAQKAPQSPTLISELGRAAGEFGCIPSAVSGHPLHYFTPSPLHNLLQRCQLPTVERSSDLSGRYVGLALVREASRYGAATAVDKGQALRFSRLFSRQQTAYKSAGDLVDVARKISGAEIHLRQEIVFAGGRTASQAQHIFAPHPVLPELMENLLQVLNDNLTEIDPAVITAVTGFFAVHAHPFLDANGRWARLIATSAGLKRDPSFPAIANAVFQNACKAELADNVWPNSRANGLRDYLELSFEFEHALSRRLIESGAKDIISRINFEIETTSNNNRDLETILFNLYSFGEVRLEEVKNVLGISSRVLDGLSTRLIMACGSVKITSEGMLNIHRILETVGESTLQAKHDTFKIQKNI